ncbi:MAG TPA: hypothetical protein PL029_03575 [Bacteroidia bacterium]|nr:hypothetical protein [Bacteroidia bacterium]
MPVQFDTFSQGKIDGLKTHLETAASKGKAKSYEIWVDGLQVIPRTEEPSEFDNYEEYLTADTNQVKVVIYCTDKTNRNDKFIFQLKAKNPQEAVEMGIAGLPVKTFNSREIDHWRQKQNLKTEQNREIGNLRDEVEELTGLLDEKQKYIEELEAKVQEAKANGNKIGGIDLGRVLTSGLEDLIRNNTKFIARMPGLAGLAEEIDADTKSRNINTSKIPEAQVEGEATFKKKDSPSDGIILTDQEKELLNFFKQIQRHFSQAEFEQVINILDLLSKDKSELETVLAHLNGEDQEEK